jgi:glucan phosphoethanolaminetransferase (alkaline phosphatase superfamily)
MTDLNQAHPLLGKAKEKLLEELKSAFYLAIYFATWFCAMVFLGLTALDGWPIPLAPFGFALIKAILCAKFMLVAQAFFPIVVKEEIGILRSLLKQSLVYLIVVLLLTCLESGLDGWIHHRGLIESLKSFDHNNIAHLIATSLMYWLIVWPYLILTGIKLSLGNDTTKQILLGKRKN